MSPLYDYVCRSCGTEVETDLLLSENTRHIREEDGYVCGTLRRVWSSINVNIENIKAVPRGR